MTGRSTPTVHATPHYGHEAVTPAFTASVRALARRVRRQCLERQGASQNTAVGFADGINGPPHPPAQPWPAPVDRDDDQTQPGHSVPAHKGTVRPIERSPEPLGKGSLPISGLQLLTYYNFVTVDPYSPRRWKNLIPQISGTEWEIRNLLDKMGIAIAIPRHFKYLANVRRRMRKGGARADALGVMIKMRNVATHPTKQQSGDYSIYEWVESELLANYWLCLALLFTVGYTGDVAGVLQPRARYAGELPGTPWGKEARKPWRVGGKSDRA